jgi:hypothetical protein
VKRSFTGHRSNTIVNRLMINSIIRPAIYEPLSKSTTR